MFERTIPTPASFSAEELARLGEVATRLIEAMFPCYGPIVVEDDATARDVWRRFRWGTNRDTLGDGNYMSVHDGEEATRISFETAWSPPLPVVREMSRQWPNLAFRLVWDGAYGEAGEATFRAGEGSRREYPEGTSDRDRVSREYHDVRRELGVAEEEDGKPQGGKNGDTQHPSDKEDRHEEH